MVLIARSSESQLPSARPLPLPDDVITGLRSTPKRLPCRLLYDAAGAALFEQICTLDAYYPTRTELSLLAAHLPAIAADVGPAARVIEPGSGEGVKTRKLLYALERPASYVPIDVSREQLDHTAAVLRANHPAVDIQPLAADYMAPFALPVPRTPHARTLVFFPGSTIGNFEPADAKSFLAGLRERAGADARLLIGADATREPAQLLRAYDDELGVTAAFNKNLLVHLNRARDATFDPDAFAHRAVWNAAASRIEMHLVSRRRQLVRIGRDVIAIAADESIVTEHCYKHTPAAMAAILAGAGWKPREVFVAAVHPFHLWLCEPT